MVDTSIFEQQTKKAQEDNIKSLIGLLEQKAYVTINIDGYEFKIKRLGINELKLIEKIKDDTNETEIVNVIKTIMAKMLLVDEEIIAKMDDGVLFYLFMQIVSKLSKEIAGDVENFPKP